MPIVKTKKTACAPTPEPSEENLQDDTTTIDINPSSPISSQAVDSLTSLLLDVGVNVDVEFRYDRLGNFTGYQIKNDKYNRFVKHKHRDALGESVEILKEVRRAEYDNCVYEA